MPVERTGYSIGSYWICPNGKDLSWHDIVDTREEKLFKNGEGITCCQRTGEIQWRWKGERIAGVFRHLMESGVEVWQVSVSPDISSIQIPSKLISQIRIWVSAKQDGDGLCQQIQESCHSFNLDDKGCAAVGLLVHLLREGWIKV